MSDSDYDKEVEPIQAYNQPILDAFGTWLKEAGLADCTIKNHVENIALSAIRFATNLCQSKT